MTSDGQTGFMPCPKLRQDAIRAPCETVALNDRGPSPLLEKDSPQPKRLPQRVRRARAALGDEMRTEVLGVGERDAQAEGYLKLSRRSQHFGLLSRFRTGGISTDYARRQPA
jgi:hypothetical protein